MVHTTTSRRRDASRRRSDLDVALGCSSTSSAPHDRWSSTCKIVEMGAKGLGLVVTRSFSRGERIWEEPPLLTLPSKFSPWASSLESSSDSISCELDIVDILCQRDKASQRSFWELTDALADGDTDKTCVGIVRTNAIAAGLHARVFARTSRLNHSCRPNVHNTWQEPEGVEVLYATEDIQVGEELCISYIYPFKATNARQDELRRKWGFTCRCAACKLAGPARARSDTARVRLAELERQMLALADRATNAALTQESKTDLVASVLQTLETMKSELQLELGLNPALLYRMFSGAARVLLALGRCSSASYVLAQAHEASRASTGEASQQSVEMFRALHEAWSGSADQSKEVTW